MFAEHPFLKSKRSSSPTTSDSNLFGHLYQPDKPARTLREEGKPS
jgi:hypothetical protein